MEYAASDKVVQLFAGSRRKVIIVYTQVQCTPPTYLKQDHVTMITGGLVAVFIQCISES